MANAKQVPIICYNCRFFYSARETERIRSRVLLEKGSRTPTTALGLVGICSALLENPTATVELEYLTQQPDAVRTLRLLVFSKSPCQVNYASAPLENMFEPHPNLV